MPSNPDHPPPPAAATGASTVHPPPPKPNPKLLSLLLKALIMIFITTLFFLFLGVAAILLLLATAALHRHSNPANSDLKRRLPQFRFSRRMQGGETDECVVCLDSIKQGQWCRKLPGCGHLFHRRCVDPWLVKVPACPICRARVQLVEEERSGALGFDWRNDFRVW
ncbi:unnamed protein product [Linum tenue]|uniref:RING-type domain-containing protein n=2 Tax=Linum tenue TaxID=586396 RepID=A0AAV0I906_9ROSI|nr:unnamed protein product [Linum tenue]